MNDLTQPTDWVRIDGGDAITDINRQVEIARNLAILMRPQASYMGDTQTDIMQAILDGMQGDWRLSCDKGRIARRINRILYTHCREDMNENAARYLESATTQYRIGGKWARIATNIDWQDGDYADQNSCYWGFNIHHRAALIAAGAGAVQVKADPTSDRGLGRALLLPHRNRAFLFNAYGLELAAFVQIYRYLVAGYDLHYKEVEFHARVDDPQMGRTAIYINHDTAYVFCRTPLKAHARRSVQLEPCLCFGNAAGWPSAQRHGLPECDNCPLRRVTEPDPAEYDLPY